MSDQEHTKQEHMKMVTAAKISRDNREKRINDTAQELYEVLKSRGVNIFEYEQAIKVLDSKVRFRTYL